MSLVIPSRAIGAKPKGPGRAYVIYKVKPGDTLRKIARRFDISVRAIRRANKLHSSRIHPGQRLKIPIRSVRPGRAANARCGPVYIVRAGDTLGGIARRCRVSERRLLTYNYLTHAVRLYVGQRLRIPAGPADSGRDYLPRPFTSGR